MNWGWSRLALSLLILTIISTGCGSIHKKWAEIDRAEDPVLYSKYLEQHPNGPYKAICQKRLNESNWKKDWLAALRQNDTSVYENYLENYPESYYYASCEERLKNLRIASAIRQIESSNSLQLYFSVLNEYQLLPALTVAKMSGLLEDYCEWSKVSELNSIEAYNDFLHANPTSLYADKAKSRIVDLEVSQIIAEHPPKIPSADRIRQVPGRQYSVINIHNDTKYNLTVWYSGPESFKVIFQPGEKGSVELANGSYTVAASVDAKNVSNYAGAEQCDESDYEVEYYISTNFSFRLPQTRYGSFEQWPCKRRYSSYK